MSLLLAGHAVPLAGIPRRLHAPDPQGIRRTAKPGRNRIVGRIVAGILRPLFTEKADTPCPEFRSLFWCCFLLCHRGNLPWVLLSGSSFAQLSVFADDWRNESIGSLFEQYGQNIPANFADIADQNTSKWHYKNTAFAAEGLRQPGSQASARQCDLSESVDVAWAVEQLQEAFNKAETQQDQVLLLALLIHFVGDAHQPLHGISRVDDNCESDRGGNRFCFVYHNNSYSCETNLHSLWDRGVGFFESFDRIADAAEYVSRVEVDERQAKNLNPDDWLAEGFRKARFIYSIKDGSGGDSYYIKEGQIISYERIALAADRLANILNQLY